MVFVIMIQRPTPIKIPQSICIILSSSWQHFICDGEKLAETVLFSYYDCNPEIANMFYICCIRKKNAKYVYLFFKISLHVFVFFAMCCICLEICQHMQCDNLQNTIRHPLSITKRSKVKKYVTINVTVTKDIKDKVNPKWTFNFFFIDFFHLNILPDKK